MFCFLFIGGKGLLLRMWMLAPLLAGVYFLANVLEDRHGKMIKRWRKATHEWGVGLHPSYIALGHDEPLGSQGGTVDSHMPAVPQGLPPGMILHPALSFFLSTIPKCVHLWLSVAPRLLRLRTLD